jgi:hypothetical protein
MMTGFRSELLKRQVALKKPWRRCLDYWDLMKRPAPIAVNWCYKYVGLTC